MTETAARITGEQSSAAVWKDGFLPPSEECVFEELAQLGEEHERRKAQWDELSGKTRAIRDKIEADQKQRELALRDAYFSGGDTAELAGEDEKIKAELAQAEERQRAAGQAVLQSINLILQTVVEKRESWLGELQQRDADIVSEARVLEEQLRAVRARMGSTARLQFWIDRTGTEAVNFPQNILPYGEIAAQPQTEEAREAMTLAHQMRAYGTTGDRVLSDTEGREREQEALHPPDEMDAAAEAATRALQQMAREPGVVAA